MGARHAGDTRYYRLIVAHGIFAALAILIMIPAAIICARFLYHGRNPRVAMWGHIGLNTAAMLSLTITFVSGYAAVGQDAWGSNPHHLIGVSLYGAVIFQALFGLFIRARNQKKVIRKKIALHTMVCCLLFVHLTHRLPLGTNFEIAAPLAWPRYLAVGTCADSSGTLSLWITAYLVHPLCRLRFYLFPFLVCLRIPQDSRVLFSWHNPSDSRDAGYGRDSYDG